MLFFLLVIPASFAQEYENPAVKNFFKTDYNADNQNWSVTEDSIGYTYFANNKGLLEFDGNFWRLYPAPKGNIIRCVAVNSDQRIFSSG